jgi:hypothetical protein
MEGGFHPPCLVHVNRKSLFVKVTILFAPAS